jgi:hypothetical protein
MFFHGFLAEPLQRNQDDNFLINRILRLYPPFCATVNQNPLKQIFSTDFVEKNRVFPSAKNV